MLKKKLPLSKIAIIGAGAVGSTAAYVATIKNLAAEISLIDIDNRKEKGHVMDIDDGLCFVETGCVKASNFKAAKDADIIVITAGAPQKPGETRLDLVKKNIGILKSIFKKMGRPKKTAVIIMVANPVDVLTYHAQKLSGLPKSQVFGTGTSLDSARLRTEVAHELAVSPDSVSGFVLGEHGDSEFVPWSTVTVGGLPVLKAKGFNKTTANKIEKRVRREAYEIINRKGATYYGIALVIADVIEAVLYDQKKILPVTSYLHNWNGASGLCIGSPAVVGRSGVIRHWPLQLTAPEKKKFIKSVETVKQYLK